MPESVIVMDSGQEFILLLDTEPTTDTFVIYGGGPKGDPGPEGPDGPRGLPGAYVGWIGTEYPPRPVMDENVLFIGPENPDDFMLDGDSWINTNEEDPIVYTKLVDLPDVDTAGLADKKILQYDLATLKFKPQTANLDFLTDVDLTTPATDHQALVYDVGLQKWIPGDVASGGSGGAYVGARGFTPPVQLIYSETGSGTNLIWTPTDIQAGDIAILTVDADSTSYSIDDSWSMIAERNGLVAGYFGMHSALYVKVVSDEDTETQGYSSGSTSVFAVQYFRNVSFIQGPVAFGDTRSMTYTIPGGYASELAARVVSLVGTSLPAAGDIDFPTPYQDVGTGALNSNVRQGFVTETTAAYSQTVSGPDAQGMAYLGWVLTLVSLSDSPGSDWSFEEDPVTVGYDKDANSTSTRNSLGCYVWLNTAVVLTGVYFDVRNVGTYSLWVDDVQVSTSYAIPANSVDFLFEVDGELVLTPTGHKFEVRSSTTSNFYYKTGGEGTAFTDTAGSKYITKWEVQIGGTSSVPFRLAFRPGTFKPATLSNGIADLSNLLDRVDFHGVYGSDFTADEELHAKWNRVGYNISDESFGESGLVFETPKAAGNYYYQDAPAGDFTCTYKGWVLGDSVMWGLLICDASGNGVMVSPYDSPGSGIIGQITAGSYAGTFAQLLTGNLSGYTNGGGEYWLRLRKAGAVYYGSISINGVRWSKERSFTPTGFGASRIGFGGVYGTSLQAGVERFNVV